MDITAGLRSRRLLAACVLVLSIGAALVAKRAAGSIPTGAATATLLVDSSRSTLPTLSQNEVPLYKRAPVVAQMLTSAGLVRSISKAAGIPSGEVTAEGPYGGAGQILDVVTPSEARSIQLLAERKVYRLTFISQAGLPIVTVETQVLPPPRPPSLPTPSIQA